jgi:phage-related minor tail protein
MLDDKEISHREALQKQMQGFTNKFEELAQAQAADRAVEIQRLREELTQAQAADRAVEIQRLREELQAQKAEMANLKVSLPQFYD